VLHRLKAADRAAELLAYLDVPDGHLEQPLAHAQGVGRGEHRGRVGQPPDLGLIGGDDVRVRHPDPIKYRVVPAPGLVERPPGLDPGPLPVDKHQPAPLAHGHGDQQPVGRPGGLDRRRATAERQLAAVPRPEYRTVVRQARLDLACGERAHQLRPAAGPRQGERGQRAVEERAGGGRAAELLGDQAQLDHTLARAVQLLGNGEADPPELGPALPQLVVGVLARAGQRTHQRRGAACREQAAGHLAQGGLLLG